MLKQALKNWKPETSDLNTFNAGIRKKIVRRRNRRIAAFSLTSIGAALIIGIFLNKPTEHEPELSWYWTSALNSPEPDLPNDYQLLSSYLYQLEE